jgi:hypothetical protein
MKQTKGTNEGKEITQGTILVLLKPKRYTKEIQNIYNLSTKSIKNIYRLTVSRGELFVQQRVLLRFFFVWIVRICCSYNFSIVYVCVFLWLGNKFYEIKKVY